MKTNETAIAIFNTLLKGERSAVETYNETLEKFAGEPGVEQLQTIRDEHQKAVATLEQNIIALGGNPDEGSGVWGTFAVTMQSAANIFGRQSAFEVLKAGEESGRGYYEKALEDDQIPAGSKATIEAELLPKCMEHSRTLERLQGVA